MERMFYGCKSLTVLPDISTWDTLNVKNMNEIFYECISLSFIPDISKWYIYKVKEMNNIFYGCKKDLNLLNLINNLFYN